MRETVDCRSEKANEQFWRIKDVESFVSLACRRCDIVDGLIRELRVVM